MSQKYTYKQLAEFGQQLLNDTSYENGLPKISEYAKKVTGATRCSIFIYDIEINELWTTIADGVDKIIIPYDKGVVGQTIKEKKPLIVNEPYEYPYFLPDVDRETGFVTKNIATAPVFNSKKEVIGVLQLLNKDEDFDEADIKFITFFAHFISGFLELLSLRHITE